jgi:hypothetical protein
MFAGIVKNKKEKADSFDNFETIYFYLGPRGIKDVSKWTSPHRCCHLQVPLLAFAVCGGHVSVFQEPVFDVRHSRAVEGQPVR